MSPEARIEKATEIDGDLGAEEVECSGLSTGVASIFGDMLDGKVFGLPEDDFQGVGFVNSGIFTVSGTLLACGTSWLHLVTSNVPDLTRTTTSFAFWCPFAFRGTHVG
jgi:hypothetical protein